MSDLITVDPETMRGVPVFRGTRVPVQTLFEYLEGGDSLEDFFRRLPYCFTRSSLPNVRGGKDTPACTTLMRILLDECVDWRLRNYFERHQVVTTKYAGIAGLKNRRLLSADEEAGFEALINVDSTYTNSRTLEVADLNCDASGKDKSPL